MNEGKSKKIIYIVLAIVLVVILAIGVFFLINNGKESKIREEVITAENYEKVTEDLEKQLGEADEVYYYAYACMYYMMKDGFSEEYMNSQDESIIYKNIYNKTVQQLMDEGKKLMEENDVSVEEWKQKVEDLSKMD